MALGDIFAGLAQAHHEREMNDAAFARHEREKKGGIFADLANNPNYAPEQQEWFLKAAIAHYTDPKEAKKYDIKNGMVQVPVELMRAQKPLQSAADAQLKPDDKVNFPSLTMGKPTPLGATPEDMPATQPGALQPQAPMAQRIPGVTDGALLQPPTPPPALATPVMRPVDPARRRREALAAQEDALRAKAAIEREIAGEEPEKAITLSPGQAAFKGGKEIARNPKEAEAVKPEKRDTEWHEIIVGGQPKLAVIDMQTGETVKVFEADGKESKQENPPVRVIEEGGKEFYEYYDKKAPSNPGARVLKGPAPARSNGSAVDARADDRRIDTRVTKFGQEPIVKKFNTVTDALQFVRGVPDANNNPAYDQALIYAFAKAMDPDSVVREGEYATVQKYAQSWIQNFGFNAQRVLSNSEFLSAGARANMKKVIEERVKPVVTQYDNLRKSYADQINKITGGNDGESYLTDYGSAFQTPTGAPTTPAAGSGTAPEGTIIKNSAGETLVKRGGKWVKP